MSKRKHEQSFCYAPSRECGCILSIQFFSGNSSRGWRRRKYAGIIHIPGCICHFALGFCKNIKKRTETLHQSFSPFMVEHRRFELLTPTMPLWCATNCANAPSVGDESHYTILLTKKQPPGENFFGTAAPGRRGTPCAYGVIAGGSAAARGWPDGPDRRRTSAIGAFWCARPRAKESAAAPGWPRSAGAPGKGTSPK